MKEYKVYVKGKKKPFKIIATEWIVDNEFYVFLLNGTEMFRVYEDELVAIKRRSL